MNVSIFILVVHCLLFGSLLYLSGSLLNLMFLLRKRYDRRSPNPVELHRYRDQVVSVVVYFLGSSMTSVVLALDTVGCYKNNIMLDNLEIASSIGFIVMSVAGLLVVNYMIKDETPTYPRYGTYR